MLVANAAASRRISMLQCNFPVIQCDDADALSLWRCEIMLSVFSIVRLSLTNLANFRKRKILFWFEFRMQYE